MMLYCHACSSARRMVFDGLDQVSRLPSRGTIAPLARSGGCQREQGLERTHRAGSRAPVTEKAVREIEAEADAVELKRELLDVEVRAQLALVDRLLRAARDAVEPGLLFVDEVVAELAGPIVELDRRAEQRAAAVALLLRGPIEPRAEQPPQAERAGRLAQRGQDHARAEVLDDALEHGELERLLRAEVAEQAALRQARALGEPPDRESLETVHARDRHRVAQDRCACDFALDHSQ